MKKNDYPSPKVPPSPLLGSGKFCFTGKTNQNCILSIENKRFTTSGRAAIALALEDAGITSQHEVLIPAYHCESMVAPAKWRGAAVKFYKIQSNTSIDIGDIKSKISSKTKAIIVTHYFGFEQPLNIIKQICEENKIILIEDCAHAFFGKSENNAIGTTGDYAIASCMKFLPIYEGGLIASKNKDLSKIRLISPSFLFQIKSLLNPLEIAIVYNRLGLFGRVVNYVLEIKNHVWNYIKKHHQTAKASLGPTSSEGGFNLDEDWIYKRSTIFSKFIINHSPLEQIVNKRREHYTKLETGLSNLPGCRPLFETLPQHTTPWVFPLYVEKPEKYFYRLKQAGVPVWRFGEFLDSCVNETTCPISVEYSKKIFQFPCHQSLSKQDIDWLLFTINTIFQEAP